MRSNEVFVELNRRREGRKVGREEKEREGEGEEKGREGREKGEGM